MKHNTLVTTTLTPRHLTIMALLIALKVAVSLIPSVGIQPYVSMGFGFTITALAGALLGPVRGGILWVFGDVVEYFLTGTSYPFFAGYMLTAGLGAAFYGFFFYKKEITWKRVIAAVFLVTLICNVILGTLWIMMLYDKSLFAIIGMRLIKNAISFVLNSIVLYYLLNLPTMKRIITQFRI